MFCMSPQAQSCPGTRSSEGLPSPGAQCGCLQEDSGLWEGAGCLLWDCTACPAELEELLAVQGEQG